MIVSEGARRKEGVEIQVPLAVPGVYDPGPLGFLEIHDEVKAIHQHVMAQSLEDLGCLYVNTRSLGHEGLWNVGSCGSLPGNPGGFDKMIEAIAVLEMPLDAARLRAEAKDPSAGAVVVFEGCARDHHEGKSVEGLAYEAFVPMALAELDRLRTEAIERFGLLRCLIHHRIGPVPITEAAVVLVTAAAHRREAFEAAVWIMDQIKARVPIWKRERYAQGAEAWVEGSERL